ncbi:MAG: TonB-dependent receptor plug domain-containing protein, partial [Comamonas sp.]
LLAIACLTTSANALALSGLAQSYDIPAQDLNASLIRIASEGGVQLAVPAPVVRGLSAPAIKGRFTPEQALQRALVGHGLEFARTANGTLTVRPSAAVASPGATLNEVQVTASAELDSATEGSGSYASNGRSTVATPLNLTLRETPQTISVITSQRLGDQALSGIGDALQQTPGITLQNIGGERYSVMSRGYAIDSYQLDGVPTTLDVTTQDVSQSLADLAIYDRVEVLRGASGLMSGAGDPSAAINMVRKRPTADWQAHVSVGAGSWSKARAEVDLSGPLNASGSVRGRLIGAYQKSDSYIDYYQLDKQVLYGVVE